MNMRIYLIILLMAHDDQNNHDEENDGSTHFDEMIEDE